MPPSPSPELSDAARHPPAGPEPRGRQVGRWLLMLFYLLGGIGHFLATSAMARIVPPAVPLPDAVVLATGACELLGVAALAVPRWRIAAGWGFAAYALCVWPANLHHAVLDLSSGTGLPIWYHAPRLALQPAIIWWALWASGAWAAWRQSRLRRGNVAS